MNPPIGLDAKNPQRFLEAISWYKLQAPWISGASWAEMARLAVLKGEQIQQTAILSMLDDLWGRIGTSLEEGEPYSEFLQKIGSSWGIYWRNAGSPRLKLIWHNAVGGALMSGKWSQISDPAVREARPYLLFDAIDDHRTSEICHARDGVILPASDPYWLHNRPLLHHDCRSSVITLDEEEVEELGGIKGLPKGSPEPDAGWGGERAWEDWQPKGSDYHPALWKEFQKWRSGQDYAHTMDQWHRSLAQSWGSALDLDSEDLTEFFGLDLATSQPTIHTASRRVRPTLDSTEQQIRKSLNAWVLGSRSRTSTTLKLAAQAELGLPGIAYTQQAVDVAPEAVGRTRPAVRRIYEDTQRWLQQQDISEMRLYRGWRRRYGVRGIVESWSTDPEIAKKFNGGKFGGVEVMLVKAEDIFCLSGGPHFKNGKYGEQNEVMVLAGQAMLRE